MIETGQLLERFRTLSRDIQNNLQTIQKQIEQAKKIKDSSELSKISNTATEIIDAWQDFSGWILVSTLDNLEEAQLNCAPGRLDIQSKIFRSKKRYQNDLTARGIKIDSTDVPSIVIETYIQYFEQLIDLIIANSIKYSPKAGSIEISAYRKENSTHLTIKSLGPTVLKNEINQLGTSGFRSENAKKLPVAGQGFGLYNCKRICTLLSANIEFRPETKVAFELDNIQYSYFTTNLIFP
jgi:signal transduction histidine kinase